MNGAESLARTLVAGGVNVCFTNPGTSEMHFVAALDKVDGIRCVLGLFEGVVTGAADGYWRMADRPAATLLHLGPGLGNGLANLHNARKASSGIVNIVGEHATYHIKHDAPLTSDIEGIARPVSAWVRTSPSARAVAADGAAAIAAARTAPGQVATLILPADTAWNEADGVAPVPPVAAPAPVGAGGDRALRQGAALGRAGHAHADRPRGARARSGARRAHRHRDRGAHHRPGLERPHPARRRPRADRAAALSGGPGARGAEGRAASHPGRRQGPGGLLRLSGQAQRADPRRLPGAPALHAGRGLDRRARGAGRGGRRQEERRGGPAARSPRAPHRRAHARHAGRRARRAAARGRHRLRRVGDHRPRLLQGDRGRPAPRLDEQHGRLDRPRPAAGHRRRGGVPRPQGRVPRGRRQRHVHACRRSGRRRAKAST